MDSFKITLRLTDLLNVEELDLPTKKQGVTKKYICIPVDENFLYKGQSGIYYLDLVAWTNIDKESGKTMRNEFGYTHSIKKSVPRKVKEQLINNPGELQRLTPYVGNMKTLQRAEKPLYPTGDSKKYSDTIDTKALKKMDFEDIYPDDEDLPL